MPSNLDNVALNSEASVDKVIYLLSDTVSMSNTTSTVTATYNHSLGQRGLPVGIVSYDGTNWFDLGGHGGSYPPYAEELESWVWAEMTDTQIRVRKTQDVVLGGFGSNINVRFKLAVLAIGHTSVQDVSGSQETKIFSADRTYLQIHKIGSVTKPTQGSGADETVTVNHGLGYTPIVRVFDDDGSETDTESANTNQLKYVVNSSTLKFYFSLATSDTYRYIIYKNKWQ